MTQKGVCMQKCKTQRRFNIRLDNFEYLLELSKQKGLSVSDTLDLVITNHKEFFDYEFKRKESHDKV